MAPGSGYYMTEEDEEEYRQFAASLHLVPLDSIQHVTTAAEMVSGPEMRPSMHQESSTPVPMPLTRTEPFRLYPHQPTSSLSGSTPRPRTHIEAIMDDGWDPTLGNQGLLDLWGFDGTSPTLYQAPVFPLPIEPHPEPELEFDAESEYRHQSEPKTKPKPESKPKPEPKSKTSPGDQLRGDGNAAGGREYDRLSEEEKLFSLYLNTHLKQIGHDANTDNNVTLAIGRAIVIRSHTRSGFRDYAHDAGRQALAGMQQILTEIGRSWVQLTTQVDRMVDLAELNDWSRSVHECYERIHDPAGVLAGRSGDGMQRAEARKAWHDWQRRRPGKDPHKNTTAFNGKLLEINRKKEHAEWFKYEIDGDKDGLRAWLMAKLTEHVGA